MPLREDLLNPIPGDNPSGVNLRYDPITDKIKDSRREDFEAPQGVWKTEIKIADWPLVIKLCGDAIATKSKDLQLAVWLVDAHVRREGFGVLQPGFTFLNGLVNGFWDTLYPEIDDGDLDMRGAPLVWLGSKLPEPMIRLAITSSGLTWAQYKESRIVGYESTATTQELRTKRTQLINEGKPTAEQFDEAMNATPKSFYETTRGLLEGGLEALTVLVESVDARFGDEGPSFVKTRSALEEVSNLFRGFITKKGGATVAKPVEPPPVAAPVPIAPAVQVVSTAAPAAPVPEPAVTPAASAEPTSVEDAAVRLAALCRFLREKDTYDISPFLMLRGFRWGQIRYNGPDKIDPTMLEAPPAELRSQLKRLSLEGNWDAVLEATERAMALPCGRAWLDVQRYTVTALEKKGDWWAFVAGAVKTSLRGLLEDLPKLLDMSLMDDTPTANPETKAWIEQHVMAKPAPVPWTSAPVVMQPEPVLPPLPVAAPPVLSPASLDHQDVLFEQALNDARAGKVDQAIKALHSQLASETSGRGRFLRRVQVAHILSTVGQDRIAHPILTGIATEIERRSLEDWEDLDALAYPLSLLLQCLQSNGSEAGERESVYARICRLDPVRALTLQS